MIEGDPFLRDTFPRASAYHPDWIISAVSGAANPLWLTEWLCEELDLKPGMRVLDLGCGRAMSSVFLNREFGVQVWATDLWFDASENLQRIRDAGVDDGVFPIHADARSLPFAAEFFDAIVSIDSFFYYGTDDLYLNYVARYLKPGGLLAIAGAGLVREFEGEIPPHLQGWWTSELCCLHSAEWWKQHWNRTGLVNIELADALPDGWKYWADWIRAIAPENSQEIRALDSDAGSNLGYLRAIARLRPNVRFTDPIVSVTTRYAKSPLLRSPYSDRAHG